MDIKKCDSKDIQFILSIENCWYTQIQSNIVYNYVRFSALFTELFVIFFPKYELQLS